ncbi:hypothetical protein Nmel_012116 [Mimus melanotis]
MLSMSVLGLEREGPGAAAESRGGPRVVRGSEGWQSWHCSPAKVKLQGDLTAALQCLKGAHRKDGMGLL